METLTLQELIKGLTLDQFLIEISSKKLYIECMRLHPVFCSLVFFWIGCNIGSFLNVCIYRLPLGMSLFRPKSHCPKCGHKLGVAENIPIFSYLFLLGSCKECGERISPRYLIVEALTGFIFAGIYLNIYFCYQPITSLLLLFFMASVFLTAAFTDCDLRIIPDTVSLPGMILIPAYWYFHNWPSLRTFDMPALIRCLIGMAVAGIFFSAFHLLGKRLFKREAFGWGDVKLIVLIAGAFSWGPTLFIVLAASIIALIYMPVYWHFFPRRKNRGFPFAPFLAVCVIGWCILGTGITWLVFPGKRPAPVKPVKKENTVPAKKAVPAKPAKKPEQNKAKPAPAKKTAPAQPVKKPEQDKAAAEAAKKAVPAQPVRKPDQNKAAAEVKKQENPAQSVNKTGLNEAKKNDSGK